MPTMEIASIGAKKLILNPDNFKVALETEKKLQSHRGLFYDFLKQQKGIIVHIGSAYHKTGEGGYDAGGIVDWSYSPEYLYIPYSDESGAGQEKKYKILPEYILEINSLLEAALNASPQSLIYFLTDYQFGPAEAAYKDIDSITTLWELHDKEGLVFNTLYTIRKF